MRCLHFFSIWESTRPIFYTPGLPTSKSGATEKYGLLQVVFFFFLVKHEALLMLGSVKKKSVPFKAACFWSASRRHMAVESSLHVRQILSDPGSHTTYFRTKRLFRTESIRGPVKRLILTKERNWALLLAHGILWTATLGLIHTGSFSASEKERKAPVDAATAQLGLRQQMNWKQLETCSFFSLHGDKRLALAQSTRPPTARREHLCIAWYTWLPSLQHSISPVREERDVCTSHLLQLRHHSY